MGKTRGFLAFFTFVFIALFGAHAFADGYTCSEAMNFVSCGVNYYLTNSEEINPVTGVPLQICAKCSPGCTCAGGTADQDCPVTCADDEELVDGQYCCPKLGAEYDKYHPSYNYDTVSASCGVKLLNVPVHDDTGNVTGAMKSVTCSIDPANPSDGYGHCGTILESDLTCEATYYAGDGARQCPSDVEYSETGQEICAEGYYYQQFEWNISDVTNTESTSGFCVSAGNGHYSEANSYERYLCPTGYQSGSVGSSKSDCVLKTAPGKYVATAGGSETDCPAGDFCAGNVSISYGTTGGNTPCSDGTYSEGAAQSCTSCPPNSSSNSEHTACVCNDGYNLDSKGNCVQSVYCTPGFQYNESGNKLESCENGYFCTCPTGENVLARDTVKTKCDSKYPNTDGNADGEDDCYTIVGDGYYFNGTDETIAECPSGHYGSATGNTKVYKNSNVAEYGQDKMCTSCPQPSPLSNLEIATAVTSATEVTQCYVSANTTIHDAEGRQYSFTDDCYADKSGNYSCTRVYSLCLEGEYIVAESCESCSVGYACDGKVQTICNKDKYSDSDSLKQCKSCPSAPSFDGLNIQWDYQANESKNDCNFDAEYTTDKGTWTGISCSLYGGKTYRCTMNNNIDCATDYVTTSELYTGERLNLSSDNLESVINAYCVEKCKPGYTLDTCDDGLQYAFGVCFTEDGLSSGYTLEECANLTEGWSTVDYFRGNGCAANLDDGNTDNDIFVAHTNQCVPNVYKITLNNNGGTGGTDVIYEKYATGWYANADTTGTVSSVKVPTRDGFEFLGYMTSCNLLENPSVLTDSTGKITANADTFLADTGVNACWGNRKYTVTLDNNGGSGGESNTISMKYNIGWYNCTNEQTCKTTKLAMPERNGYTFGGYYYNDVQVFDGNGNLVDGNTTVYNGTDNEFELVAKWNAKAYAININYDGGSGSLNTIYQKYNDGWYTCAATTTNCKITQIQIPSRLGYTSTGAEDEYGNIIITADGYLTDDTTLFDDGNAPAGTATIMATWEPNMYTITMNHNGGTSDIDAIYELYNTGWYADANAGTKITSINRVPERPGYDFAGYKTKCTAAEIPQNVVDKDAKIVANTTLFTENSSVCAWWNNRKYTVTLNNGTGINNTISMTYGIGWYNSANTQTTKLAVPVRDGYTFGGYYYNDVQVFDSNGNLVDGNTTVYNGTNNEFELVAKWNANVYKVTLTNLTPWSTESERVVYLCYDNGWYDNDTCSGTTADLQLLSESESWTFSGVYSDGKHTLNAANPSVTAFTTDVELAAQWNQETMACVSGKYYPGTGTTLLDCNAGDYCPDGADKSVVLGTTNACQPQSCPTAYTVHGMSVKGTSNANAKHENECYIADDIEFTDKSGTYTCADANYNGTTYNCTKVYNKCEKGLYLDGNQCTTCPAGHICTGGDALPEQCTNGTYADTDGMFACKPCPTPKYGQYATVSSSDDGKSCVVKYNMLPVNNGKVSVSCGGTDTLLCSITNPSTDADSESDYMMCNAGYYAPNGSASVNVQNVVIDDLMSKIAAVCQPSGIGYYTPADSMTREQCPTTEITVDENETVTGTTSTTTASDASQCHVPSTIVFTDDNGTYTCGGNTAYDKNRHLYNCTKVYSKCVAGQRPIDGQCESCPKMPYAGGTFGSTTDSVVCPVVYNKHINISNGQMYVSSCEYDTNNSVYVCKSGDSIVNCNAGYYIANINEYVANNTIIATPTCTPAETGHYADGLSGYAQKACVAGTYQDQTGASACKSAQPGYYVENDAATAQTLCVGTSYSEKSNATQCIACPALGIKTAQNVRAEYNVLHNSTNGTVNTLHDSQNGCAWTFDMPIANGKLENISCNVGEKCTVPVSALTCNSGHGFNTTDIELSSGAFIAEKSNIVDGDFANVCSVCAGDSYSASGTAGNSITTVCTLCPPEYRDSTETGHSAINQCQMKVDTGFYVATATGAQQPCPQGKYCPDDGILSYGDTTMTYSCDTTINPNGKYDFAFTTDGRAYSVDECYTQVNAGQYMHDGIIENCVANTSRDTSAKVYYDSNSGTMNRTQQTATQCSLCVAGTYQNATGATTCKVCPSRPADKQAFADKFANNVAGNQTYCAYTYTDMSVINGTVGSVNCALDANSGYICDAPSTANCDAGYLMWNNRSGKYTVDEISKNICATPATYSIKYELYGGTNYAGALDEYTHTYGATISGTPVRDGYYFQGWCTDASCKNWSDTYEIAPDYIGNITIHAKWLQKGTCQPGYTYDGKEHTECARGMYCDSTDRYVPGVPGCDAKMCPGDYTNGTGVATESECWKECALAENAYQMTGRDYYGIADTCEITMCKDGYTLVNGKCEPCPEGMFCNTQRLEPFSCADITGDSNTTSERGSDDSSDCYITCSSNDIDVVYGTAIPVQEQINWNGNVDEFQCEFMVGVSMTGNPCDIVARNGQFTCVETSCVYDQYMGGDGFCQKCKIDNAKSYLDTGGNCVVAECESGFHPNGNSCVSDVIDCTDSMENAQSAKMVWDAKRGMFGECRITACDYGYHIEYNTCHADEQVCEVEHGMGIRQWNGADWGTCVAQQCNPGYTKTYGADAQCVACDNMYNANGERVASSYVEGCEIATCMYHNEKYALENNQCVFVCRGTDATGYRRWDDTKKRCVTTCNPGYMQY